MTRINYGVEAKCLTDQHLLAELRELPRIFTAIEKKLKKYGTVGTDIPSSFKLGRGHVKFFYDKPLYLSNRHKNLRIEYYNRFHKPYPNTPEYRFSKKMNIFVLSDTNSNREITSTERNLVKDRISLRILESFQQPRYYRNKVSKQKAIDILWKRTL